MIVKTEIDPETGDTLIKLPDEIIEQFNLKPGDTVHYEVTEDGKIIVTFN